jgi:hypothetical protein
MITGAQGSPGPVWTVVPKRAYIYVQHLESMKKTQLGVYRETELHRPQQVSDPSGSQGHDRPKDLDIGQTQTTHNF